MLPPNSPLLQSTPTLHGQPLGQGLDMVSHSPGALGIMPSKSAWEMVMIFPTPAASMYAVEMDVLSGDDADVRNQERLRKQRKNKTCYMPLPIGNILKKGREQWTGICP